MLFELLFAGVVIIAMPIRAWRRYRRQAGPAPAPRYILETLLLTGMLSALLWRRNIPFETLGLSTDLSARWLRDLAICLLVIVAPDVWMVWRATRRSRKAVAPPAPQGLAADALRLRGRSASVVAVIVVGAVWEELFFRGAVFALAPHTPGGVAAGIIGGSLAFGAQHLRNGPSGMIHSMTFGVIFALLFVVTGNLWAVMIAHAVGNLLAAWQWAPRIEMARQRSLRRAPTFLG
jgi:membrane protease YdiL (CAAX protease family)